VVVSIGGSILVPEGKDASGIASIARCLSEASSRLPLLVTVGGGSIARKYIEWGRELEADEFSLDEMGISATRMNAQLLVLALQRERADVLAHPALQIPEAVRASRSHAIVVMGGTHPGHTTDAVAAMLATKARAARLVNATSVDGVYDADPRKSKEAKRFAKMTFAELLRLVSPSEYSAGSSAPFDPLGAKVLAKSRIPLAVVLGSDLSNLARAIRGEKFDGTMVR
jgi:uridylate kinase